MEVAGRRAGKVGRLCVLRGLREGEYWFNFSLESCKMQMLSIRYRFIFFVSLLIWLVSLNPNNTPRRYFIIREINPELCFENCAAFLFFE